MSLDRAGIRKLMAVYTLGHLCLQFGISRPTLRYYMNGIEPKHDAITQYINNKVKEMLKGSKD